VRDGRRGDPEVVGPDKLVGRTEAPRRSGIMVGSGLVHRENVESREHRGAGRVVKVTESLCKLAGDDPGQTRARDRLLVKKVMGPAWPTFHLPLEIDEKAGIEEKVAHRSHGSSGGASTDCAASSRSNTLSSATGRSRNCANNDPQVFACFCQVPRLITCEKDSFGVVRAAASTRYASKSTEIVFVAMHGAYTGLRGVQTQGCEGQASSVSRLHC
jgi:hypothetical protein